MASKEDKLKQRFDLFLRQFISPLLLGGDLHIGLPINREESEYFRVGETSDELRVLLSNIEDKRERICLEWTRSRLGLPLFPEDQATLALAVSMYNLLFLSHPIAETWGTGGSLQKVTDFTLELLDYVPNPTNLREALANHSLLYGLLSMYRTDVEVRWWVGKQEFQGTQPPRRLLMWKSVRRVTEHKQKTSWFDFAMTEQQISLWKVMLQKSPLTNLALPKRRWPLALHESFLSLEDGDVWRGLCALYLSMGFVTPVAALGQALWSLVGVMPFSEASLSATPPNTRLTKRVAQLFYHLCVLGLYLRGDELLEQIASQLSGGATSASEGQPGGQPEDNGAKLLLLTFATLLDTEQQRSVLRVPNELRPNEQNPNKLTKTLRSMYDLTMKVVPRTEYDRCLSHLMGSL